MVLFAHAPALRHTVLTLLVAALIAPVAAPAPAQAVTLSTEEAAFCTLVNNYRASRGLPRLLVSDRLSNASAWYSNDMATKDYVNYNHVDSLGRGIKERIEDFGYTYNTYWGENIAWGFPTAAEVFQFWKNSSSHNSNMLNQNFRVIGIGQAYDGSSRYGHYWTTDFGGYVDSGAVPCPGDNLPDVELVSVSVGDVEVIEGNSTTGETKLIRFKVSIPEVLSEPVRVSYATRNGTAAAGVDYLAESGQVRIAAGNRSATVAVEVVKDKLEEGNETLYLDISSPLNAVLGDATAVGTILNDD